MFFLATATLAALLYLALTLGRRRVLSGGQRLARASLAAVVAMIAVFWGTSRLFGAAEPATPAVPIDSIIARYELEEVAEYRDAQQRLKLVTGRGLLIPAFTRYADSLRAAPGTTLMVLYFSNGAGKPIPASAIARARSWGEAMTELRADSVKPWLYVYRRPADSAAAVIDCTGYNSVHCP